jgi:hypothetical protein
MEQGRGVSDKVSEMLSQARQSTILEDILDCIFDDLLVFCYMERAVREKRCLHTLFILRVKDGTLLLSRSIVLRYRTAYLNPNCSGMRKVPLQAPARAVSRENSNVHTKDQFSLMKSVIWGFQCRQNSSVYCRERDRACWRYGDARGGCTDHSLNAVQFA